jgi:hypothetical protein
MSNLLLLQPLYSYKVKQEKTYTIIFKPYRFSGKGEYMYFTPRSFSYCI